MQKIILVLSLLLCTFCCQHIEAQTTQDTQEQIQKAKQDFKDGKLTEQEYKDKVNALLQQGVSSSTKTPGDHITKGGRCLVAGTILIGVGGALAGTSVLWQNSGDGIFISTVCAGSGIAFIGLICDIAGGSQLIKGGKKLNSLRIGFAQIQLRPASTGVGFAMKF